jgi:hypothetical protein
MAPSTLGPTNTKFIVVTIYMSKEIYLLEYNAI